jgi:carnitine-CoA ligase
MIAGWDAPDDRVLPRLLRRQAGEQPDGEFLRIEDGPAGTFGQVLAAAERIAGRLAGLGVGRGDLVPLAAGPVPDGTVLAGDGVSYRDTASVLFTSGTTGPAKGVIMTNAQTYAIAQEIVDGLRVTERDVFYCFHPMFHMTRFGSVHTALLAGCPVVLDCRFDPAVFLDWARRYGATATIGHGPILEAIYRQPERPDDADNLLPTILTAPQPARIAGDFERRLGVRAIDTWGMTEMTCVTMRPYQTPLRPGSCGRPRDDLLEVRIADPETDEVLPVGQVGEITVRPREPWVVMQGYLGMPDVTVAAWRNFRFHSGDFGYLNPGRLPVLRRAVRRPDPPPGRERVGLRHRVRRGQPPAGQDCAAVGVPSEFESDDDIKLCVVPAPGPPLAEADLIRHLVGALPHHMVPRYIEVLPGLPRTPTGKIQRPVLRASGTGPGVWDRAAAGVSVRALSREGQIREEQR